MTRYLIGVAFGTVLTLLILGSLGARVYVPLVDASGVGTATPGLGATMTSTPTPQATATPGYDFALVSPYNYATPTDGPLTLAITGASFSHLAEGRIDLYSLLITGLVTYNGQPLAGAQITDPIHYAYGATTGADGTFTVNVLQPANETYRGRLLYYNFTASYQGRISSIAVTKRVLIQ